MMRLSPSTVHTHGWDATGQSLDIGTERSPTSYELVSYSADKSVLEPIHHVVDLELRLATRGRSTGGYPPRRPTICKVLHCTSKRVSPTTAFVEVKWQN